MINKILISIGIVICIYCNYNKRVEHFYGFISYFKTDDFWELLCIKNPFPLSFDIGDIIDKLFGKITNMFMQLKDALKGDFMTNMIEYIGNIGDAITNAASSFIIKIQLRIVDIPSAIKNKLLNVVEKGYKGIRKIYENNIGNIKSSFSSIVDIFKELVLLIENTIKNIGSIMEELVSTVLNFLKNVLKKLHGILTSILSLLLKAVSAFNWLISKIGSMISGILKLLNPKKILTTIFSIVLKVFNMFKSLFTLIVDIFTGKLNPIKYIQKLIKNIDKLIKHVASSFI